jgi:hypothetical protein
MRGWPSRPKPNVNVTIHIISAFGHKSKAWKINLNPNDHRSAEGSEAHRRCSKCLAEDSNKRLEKGRVLNCLGSQIPRKAGDRTLYIFSRSQNLKRVHIYYLPESNKVVALTNGLHGWSKTTFCCSPRVKLMATKYKSLNLSFFPLANEIYPGLLKYSLS